LITDDSSCICTDYIVSFKIGTAYNAPSCRLNRRRTHKFSHLMCDTPNSLIRIIIVSLCKLVRTAYHYIKIILFINLTIFLRASVQTA
jgi:hypothetical protein